jgi:hypothetical protein
VSLDPANRPGGEGLRSEYGSFLWAHALKVLSNQIGEICDIRDS